MDEPYAATPFWTLVRKRAGWLHRAVPQRDAHRHRDGPLRGGDRPRRRARPLRAAHHLERRQLRLPGRLAHHPRPGGRRAPRAGLVAGDAARVLLRASCSAASSASWASCASRSGRWSSPQTYGPHWPLVASTIWVSLIGVVLWGTLSGSHAAARPEEGRAWTRRSRRPLRGDARGRDRHRHLLPGGGAASSAARCSDAPAGAAIHLAVHARGRARAQALRSVTGLTAERAARV